MMPSNRASIFLSSDCSLSEPESEPHVHGRLEPYIDEEEDEETWSSLLSVRLALSKNEPGS